MGTLKSQSNGP